VFRLILYTVIIGLTWANTAMAASLSEARALFNAGQYDAAISMAKVLETPEGLLLAAETLSAKVMLGYVDDPNKSAKRARKWAQSALKGAPDSQEAHVQYALARGFETRTSSPISAWRKRLPRKTRAAINEVRSLYPDDPRGAALLGAWHLGIVRKAGHKNGKKWYGASEADGVNWYKTAMEAAPQDIVIASNYAVTVLALNQEKYLDQSRDILKRVTDMVPRNAMEKEVQTRMKSLLPYFNDKDALTEKVNEMLDEN